MKIILIIFCLLFVGQTSAEVFGGRKFQFLLFRGGRVVLTQDKRGRIEDRTGRDVQATAGSDGRE